MEKLIKLLKSDQELIELREKWKKEKSTPFPPYNYDEYGGVDDYKNKIKSLLASS